MLRFEIHPILNSSDSIFNKLGKTWRFLLLKIDLTMEESPNLYEVILIFSNQREIVT